MLRSQKGTYARIGPMLSTVLQECIYKLGER